MSTRGRPKDRTLNTRIPAELDRELREQAERLDMPVSELVRGVLSKTVNLLGNLTGNVEHLVNNIVEDVAAIGSGVSSAPRTVSDRAADDLLERVLGWQEIRIQQPTRCALTDVPLDAGATAHLGISAEGRPVAIISASALERVLADAQKSTPRVAITLTRPVTCAATGRTLAVGERAWFEPGADPLEFVCDEAHEAQQEET